MVTTTRAQIFCFNYVVLGQIDEDVVDAAENISREGTDKVVSQFLHGLRCCTRIEVTCKDDRVPLFVRFPHEVQQVVGCGVSTAVAAAVQW